MRVNHIHLPTPPLKLTDKDKESKMLEKTVSKDIENEIVSEDI